MIIINILYSVIQCCFECVCTLCLYMQSGGVGNMLYNQLSECCCVRAIAGGDRSDTIGAQTCYEPKFIVIIVDRNQRLNFINENKWMVIFCTG